MKRTARATIVAVIVAVVLLPFVLLSIAWVYERLLVADDLRLFSQLGAKATSSEGWPALAHEHALWLRRIDADGEVTFDSDNAAQAQGFSLLGGFFEAGLTFFGAPSPLDSLVTLDASLGASINLGEIRL